MRSGSVLAKKQQTIRPYDAVRHGVCGNCPSGCGLKLFMRGSEPVEAFGDEEHPFNKGSLCPKAPDLSPARQQGKRLLTPCLRKSAGDAWREVSWETALDAVAEGLVASSAGLAALPAFASDPLDYVIGADWCASLLAQAAGPACFVPPALGPAGALAAMYGLPGAELLMNSQRDWAISRVILVAGGDMPAESPISFGPLEDARDRGSTLLYLGACGGMSALRATEALLVAPGTEALALAALIHILLRDGKADLTFLAENATGLETLRGKTDALSPAAAAAACGVSVEQLERFAQLLGRKLPLQVQPMPGLDDAALSLCGALVALRGCVGIPGGGLNVHGVSPFRCGTSLFGGDTTPRRLDQLLAKAACRAVIGFGDFASALPGGGRTRAALQACALVVHAGCFDDATRALAHVSLPAAHWSEYAALRDRSDSRTVQWSDALAEPVGDSRTPLEIWTALAARLAPASKPAWENAPGADPMRRMAAFALAACPLTAGIRVDDLDPDVASVSGGIMWPCPKPEDAVFERSRFIRGTVRGSNILFADGRVWPGANGRFPTADGRIHLEAAKVPAAAAQVSGLALVLTEQVMHAPNQPAVVLRRGRPLATVYLETAARLGLLQGDAVRVSSADAVVEAVLRVNWSARPDCVALEPAFGSALLPVGAESATTVVRVEKFGN